MNNDGPVTVSDEDGGTIVIDTFDLNNRNARVLTFHRAPGGWVLKVETSNAVVIARMPITYTQANVLGFMMRAARGDDE